MAIRLDKYLAEMQVGTRSEVKKYIKNGRVQVNEETVFRPEIKVNPEQDLVLFDGETIGYIAYEYYMLNKPAGYVSARTDEKHKTVLELITTKKRKDLFPVGRLDIDTEGLLIITNDGELSHKLLAPGKHVPKTYYVRVVGKVTEEDVQQLAKGIDIGDEDLTLPAQTEILSYGELSVEDRESVIAKDVQIAPGEILLRKDTSVQTNDVMTELEITITEGRYHQIKRMFGKLGKPVRYLKRIRMGDLSLDPVLLPGGFRALTGDELARLNNNSKGDA